MTRRSPHPGRDEIVNPDPDAPRIRGVVKKLIPAKGFGFIQVDGGAAEYFLHRSAFEDQRIFDRLREGDRVSFQGGTVAKGLRAFDVELI